MSYLDCLKKSRISDKKRREAEDIYKSRFDDYKRDGISDADADAAAAKETADAIDLQTALQKKRKIKTIQAQQTIKKNLDSYRNSKGEKDYAAAALAIFTRDEFSKYATVERRSDVIKGQAHAVMSDFLQKYEPKVAGTIRPKAGLDNIVKELFGEGTKDKSAKELADSLSESFEVLRLRANRAGANIGKKENFGMPQTHDRVKVSKVSRDEWVNFVINKLDWEKMKDPNTELPIPALKRQAVLESVYDTIKTEGYSKLKNGEMGRIGALDKRLANHRFLEFKDGSNWLEYHSKFGIGTPFDVAISHIDKMSRDIALMELLGPNPNTGKETIKAFVKQWAADIDVKATGASKRLKTKDIEKTLNQIDEFYATLANTNVGASEDIVSYSFAGVRNILTSAYLGSASLLAIPGDTFTKAMTKSMNKMPAALDMSKYIKLLSSKENQGIAIRAGLIAESATSIAYGQQRFLGQITGPQITRRIADTVMRASLMSPHTQAAKWSFGMEVMGMFSDYSAKSFNDLPFKKSMSKYGITPQDWDIYRATKPMDEKGSKFIRPDDVRVRDDLDPIQAQDLADKFMEYVLGETEFAVPSSSLRGRAFLISDTRPGTLVGEIARSFAMFKNFPVTVIYSHIRRGLSQDKLSDKLAYTAAFGLGMTISGALGLQMRQITQGKDPMNMNPETEEGRKFWANSALAGGGMAIWGDFLFSDVNRYGGGMEATIAGPVFSALNDIRNLTIGNIVELAEGKDTNFASELTRNVNNMLPGKSIWYLRLALQRAVFDQIQLEVDPKAARKFRNMERKLQKETGQDYFWSPGELTPERAPDFSSVIQD